MVIKPKFILAKTWRNMSFKFFHEFLSYSIAEIRTRTSTTKKFNTTHFLHLPTHQSPSCFSQPASPSTGVAVQNSGQIGYFFAVSDSIKIFRIINKGGEADENGGDLSFE